MKRLGYAAFASVAWRASPPLVVAGVLTMLGSAIAPLGAVAAIGAVVGRVGAIADAGLDSPAATAAMWWTVAAGAFFLAQRALAASQESITSALGFRVDALLQRDLMDAVMRPSEIGHLEDSDTLNLIEVGRDTYRAGWARPGRLGGTIAGVVRGRMVFVGAAIVLARFSPAVGAAFFAVGLWATYEDKRASRTEATHHHGATEVARRTSYYSTLASTPEAAKEVRIFGLGDFLHDRFMASWRQSMVEVLSPGSPRPLLAAAAVATIVCLTVVWIAREAVGGGVTAGDAAVYIQALMVGLGGVQATSNASVQTELSLETLNRYRQALDTVAASSAGEDDSPGTGVSAEGLPATEIRFEGVSFSYPGGDAPVLDGLDFTIPAGRSLAIVGANGAGKTTLVKLLCGLYRPQAGRITVDGIDLTDLDTRSWRQQLAAVFQDSVQFEMPARVNVGFGRLEKTTDIDGIRAASVDAGIAATIDKLPAAWDTPLSAAYAGGADLSGGEWQKLGLARALFALRHGASVLMLDEPAAHLDARAEAHLYERFLTMTAGVTTIVISHRFSTVRQASAIVVLADGRVAEHGTHEELVARGGVYADMFAMQASRFAADAEEAVLDS